MNDSANESTTLKWEWAGVSDDAVKELNRQAEVCLADTVTLGIAADQRATTLAGIFGGGAVALFAAVAALLVADPIIWALLWAAAMAAACLLIAAILCAYSARPRDFYTCGYDPDLLHAIAHIEKMSNYVVEELQDRITHNRDVLGENGRVVKTALFFAVACIPVGLLTVVLVSRFL